MKYCPGCGTQQERNTRFCVGCGAPLNPAPTSPNADLPTRPPAAGPAPTALWATGAQPAPMPDPAVPDPAETDLQSRWASTRPATRARKPLLVLGLALVVLLVGAGAVYALMNSQGSPAATLTAPKTAVTTTISPTTPAPSPTAKPTPARSATAAAAARAAAKQISALLDDSSQARGVVGTATSGLQACTLSADQAVSELQAVVANRQRLLNQLVGAPFEALPSGAALRSALTTAWGASLSADQGYLAWAQNAQGSGSCPTDTANVSAANLAATAAKKSFASLWNAKVSAALHLPTRKDTDL